MKSLNKTTKPNETMKQLTSTTFVTTVEHHEVISSTNDRARELATDSTCKLPLLVIADRQTAGRGRGANRWWTGEGSLAFSLLLDLGHLQTKQHNTIISLAAAVAVVEAVRPLLQEHQVGLHWPNDVFVNDRKLAGILVEVLPDRRPIVGIGLNVNNSLDTAPDELRSIVTSLCDLTGRMQSREKILTAVLNHFEKLLLLLTTAPEEIGHRANSIYLQRERLLTVESGGRVLTGRAIGIAHDGALLLETEAGQQSIYSGTLR